MKRFVPLSGLEVRSGGLYRCAPDWAWSCARFDDWDLWVAFEGRGELRSNHGRFAIGPCDAFLFGPGDRVDAGLDPAAPLVVLAAHFELVSESVCLAWSTPEGRPPFHRRVRTGSVLRVLMTRAIAARGNGQHRQANAWFQAALMEVLDQDRGSWPAGPEAEQARRIDTICERIRARPGDRHRVSALAAELHVSRVHFARLFRKYQGTTARDFIVGARIEAARNLLLGSNHAIGRIAELLGYENPYFFSKQFREKVGVTPTGYRRGESRKSEIGS